MHKDCLGLKPAKNADPLCNVVNQHLTSTRQMEDGALDKFEKFFEVAARCDLILPCEKMLLRFGQNGLWQSSLV
ncbi:MAG: hypothetical protein H2049_02685 [Porphyrobacter sp.]|nr:hypothetical protein [Porphyrobacter sp.]